MFQFATNGTEHPHLQYYMGTYQVQTNHINLEVMCVFFESGGHVCWVMIASIPIIHFLGIIEGPGMHEHRLAFIMV